ncbi:G-type lectin S-receptor-like serine/threonine-protein kinase LECRK4 [Setaria italica]|uniref:G-type lectin S-receptor-like serine/threonine-protein kinase LECRK4 n=1 Tax=Setaria italica TaxID=4555 RepID=UPI0006484CF3|nr:G-type lectin S-receptor-like serine/threonine-protein kinase LECRK4 [Setaria italica]
MAPLLLLSLLLLLSSTSLQAQQNITLGSSLTPEGPSSFWLSPSGDFAFGFRPIEGNTSSYLLAVWFDKTSDKTVVWYAKTNDPDPALVHVSSGSQLLLNSNGALSLQDPTGTEVWNPRVVGAVYAAMLNTGNFVLAAADGSTKWGTFNNPADTILPTQVLTPGMKLRSRIIPTDYSNGRFLLDLQSIGVFLYTVAVPSGKMYDYYWSMAGNTTKLVFNATGMVYITLDNGTQISVTSGVTGSMLDYYHRATFDPDGVFRQYRCPKKFSNLSSQAWSVVDFKPPNICDSQLTNDGSGICGFNSYCTFNGTNNQSICLCPEQYSFIDEERKYKGCKPDFQPQSCDLDEAAAIMQFKMIPMNNVDWPLADHEEYSPITKDKCQQLCLADCFCPVAVFHDKSNTCWKKKMPLSNGKMGDNVERTLFIKVLRNTSNLKPQLSPSPSATTANKTKGILGAVISGITGIVFVLIVVTLYVRRRKYQDIAEEFDVDQLSGMPMRFSYEKLRECTRDFSQKIGEGGFGSVFEGKLNEDRVAVKCLESARQGKKEFLAEVETIGSIEHINLVRLLGFCVEKAHRILVYEYMPRSSLDQWIYYRHNNAPLDWGTRCRIILDIAKGLCYLHEECRRKIAHLDVKPQNILLDENFNAKLADFGLSKLIDRDQSQVVTVMRGTPGYMAPEWLTSQITEKVDIYSFGVVVMEVICGRKNIDNSEPEESIYLINLLREKAQKNLLIDMIDKQCDDMVLHKDEVIQMMRLGMWCLQNDSSRRPSMSTVVKVLEGTMTVETCMDYNFFSAYLVLSVQGNQSAYSAPPPASV